MSFPTGSPEVFRFFAGFSAGSAKGTLSGFLLKWVLRGVPMRLPRDFLIIFLGGVPKGSHMDFVVSFLREYPRGSQRLHVLVAAGRGEGGRTFAACLKSLDH